MHCKSLASIAVLGLALIAPLALAHPADKASNLISYSATKPDIPEYEPGDCYRVSSPACDKEYNDALAAFIKANPDYDFNAEPYPDNKRKNNVCKCTGSLLHGGYKGTCKYGDGWGYIDSACWAERGMCCTWCCRDGVDGYANNCVATNQDPNCPGDGPDSKDH